jgi:hypothetical protein
MRDRLIELIGKELLDYASWNTEMTLAGNYNMPSVEEVIADKILANGVIVPLLRTGQTVYRVSKNRMWEVKIWKVEICGGTVSYIDHYDKSFLERHIGKGVFLTREDAKQALKGGVQE